MNSARVSAFPSLLRAQYVLYRQCMRTQHIGCVETGNRQPAKPATKHDHDCKYTTSSSQPPFFYVPTCTPTYHITPGSEERKKTSPPTFWDSALCTLSLRWITNNNNYIILGTLEGESEVFLALCLCFTFSLFSSLPHNISYHSERPERGEWRRDNISLFSLSRGIGFSFLFFLFHILNTSVNS